MREKLREIIEKHRLNNDCSLYLDDDGDLCFTEYCDNCDAYKLGGILAKLPYEDYDEEEIYEVIDEATDDDFVKSYDDFHAICYCELEDQLILIINRI